MNSVLEILNKINITGTVTQQEEMSKHTTFKCGGKAEIYIKAKTIEDVIKVKKASLTHGFPLFILGGGANILVSDLGIPGVTLSLQHLDNIVLNENCLVADAGLSVNKMGDFALDKSHKGLEFIYGMPGSVGGAVFMNARCYGKEIADCFLWAEYLDANGDIKKIYKNSSDWDYKISPFQEKGIILLRVALEVTKGDPVKIKEEMDKNFTDRRTKGHFKFPCAGSVFKNNRSFGAPSGKIIQESGLKGIIRGDAQISDFHANIIVNLGNATSSDINFLINRVIKEVKDQKGIVLEPEVLKVGLWED